MKPLRVLHVIPSVSPRRGGPSEAILPMIGALRARGIDARIVTTDDDGPGTLDVPLGEWVVHRGQPVCFLPRVASPWRTLREFAYAPGFARWFQAAAVDTNLVHVHALFSHLPTTAMRLCRQLSRPYVSRPLGQLGTWPLRQSALRKRLYLGWREKANLRGAVALHFTSEAERDEAAPLRLDRLSWIVPHGLELPEFIPGAAARLRTELGLAATEKMVLFLGRLHVKKGLELLLPAFARLEAATLLIAGEGPERIPLERWVKAQGLVGRVRFLGRVEGAWKQLLLQGADVLALPSRHENFGVAVIETWAAGTPVVVSEAVALAVETQRHALGRVVALDVNALTIALSEILTQTRPSHLRSFVAEHYAWPAQAARLEVLYRSVLPPMPRTKISGWRGAVRTA